MTAEEEISRLGLDGLSAEDRVWIAHFFSHFGASHAAIKKFRDALQVAGFGVGGDIGSTTETTGDDYYWHHYAYTAVRASAGVFAEMDTCARALSEEHGVRYDEWLVDRDREGKPVDRTGWWDGTWHLRQRRSATDGSRPQ